MIGEKTPEVEAFWTSVCRQQGISADSYHALTFGDPKYAEYGDQITELAINRVKRATTHLAMDFELNGVSRREIGDYWVILWENMTPACLLEIVNIEGLVVHSKADISLNQNERMFLDLSQLPNNVYILNFRSAQFSARERIIIFN